MNPVRTVTHMVVSQPACMPNCGRTTHIPAPEIMPLTRPMVVVDALMSAPEWKAS